MKNQNTTTTTASIDTMMQTAQKAVYLAIRARHKNAPTEFLTDLQNSQTPDNTARGLATVCDRIHELERERDQYRKDSNRMKNYAKRIKITEEDRDSALNLADIYTAQADRLSEEIEGLYTRLDTTFTDREDLLQEALYKLVELEKNPAEITDSIIDRYIKHYAENIERAYTTAQKAVEGADLDSIGTALANLEPIRQRFINFEINNRTMTADTFIEEDWEELQNIANFRAVTSYVGKCISNLSAPDAMNRHTTKATRATADEVKTWIDLYGDTGDTVRVPNPIKRTRASECYDTMEYKEYKNTDPNKGKTTGFYRVRHWVTVAPYSYIETYADHDHDTDTEQTAVDNLGEIVGYSKSYNPFITDTGTAEEWERIIATANLTDRERTWLEHFFRKARFADYDECKQYAFSQIGITKTTNQTTFMNRLKNRLNPKTK